MSAYGESDQVQGSAHPQPAVQGTGTVTHPEGTKQVRIRVVFPPTIPEEVITRYSDFIEELREAGVIVQFEK